MKFLNHNYINKNFELELYRNSYKTYGSLSFDECFGFVPLLPLGGKKDVKHMDKVKILEHLDLIVQFTGGVLDD